MDTKISASVLLAGLFFSVAAMAAPASNDEVVSLINQRLSYMKDVAGYKANNHLAIEDLSQESKVLSASVSEAEKLGLDGESVKPFIQAQMDAAKAIQYRYRADWLSTVETGWQPQPLDQVRSKISLLSTRILSGIGTRLSRGERFNDKKAFMNSLNQKHLNASDKARLWQTLGQITLKKRSDK
ncbi:chorismate mutase [Erwinia papayae]|uniref:Chorismate mutase n=2 Tax=Erwinia TaxID=551 RepID=A0A014Q2G5_9GAMM|nr:chorismate mutase [Erwinia mallotivora]EXU77332.1 hypothetical protein BG55_00325 [Erwinia mallotivora]